MYNRQNCNIKSPKMKDLLSFLDDIDENIEERHSNGSRRETYCKKEVEKGEDDFDYLNYGRVQIPSDINPVKTGHWNSKEH
jgi:hypothetical protein